MDFLENNIENQEVDVNKLFMRSSYCLRQVLGYYYIAYMSLTREESSKIATIAVTENKILYNKDFIKSIDLSELNFINLHEIAHIMLKHVTRGIDKEQQLWGIAIDLITNKLIVNELNRVYMSIAIELNPSQIKEPGNSLEFSETVRFKMPEQAIFTENIDLNDDTAEKIYEALYKQAENNGYLDESSNELYYQFEYKGCNTWLSKTNDFRYKCSEDGEIEECVTDQTISEALDSEESEQLVDKVIQVVKLKDKENCGDNSISNDTCILKREIAIPVETMFNWKKYIEKYCIEVNKADKSFARPDKRFMYNNIVLPGSIKNEKIKAEKIKICIDTSGSIADIDLSKTYGIIERLFKNYKIDAELIYWNNKIASTGRFKNIKELYSIDIGNSGGTDVKCLFEYLDKQRVAPTLVIIFTDGEFSNNYNTRENSKRYKNALWMLTDKKPEMFKPSFGRIVQLNEEGKQIRC